jgi:hypothetical protein
MHQIPMPPIVIEEVRRRYLFGVSIKARKSWFAGNI